MRILITGADGFIGKNLNLHLLSRKDIQILRFNRNNNASELIDLMRQVDFVIHLAGSNRPSDPSEFEVDNLMITENLCRAITAVSDEIKRRVPVIYASSTQAKNGSAYGRSKHLAEKALFKLHADYGVQVHIFRLPNIFGKWGKPNYNSVVATFCNNIAHGYPIKINDPSVSLELVYVDDVVKRFIQLIDGADAVVDDENFEIINPIYTITIGELASQILAFKDSRSTLVTERVGLGLVRALYSTYVSYLPPNSFSYPVQLHGDARGVFVEMIKTPDCGQISYFTAHPGITRGGHYHHSKTEKFLVIKGVARFKFRHMHTNEEFELVSNGGVPTIVETIPGWTHDVTNIGSDELVVMLWANETFDHLHPDTYACPL